MTVPVLIFNRKLYLVNLVAREELFYIRSLYYVNMHI